MITAEVKEAQQKLFWQSYPDDPEVVNEKGGPLGKGGGFDTWDIDTLLCRKGKNSLLKSL